MLKPQNDAKSFPELVEHSFLQRLCSKRVLGWILEGFGALWGVTWPPFVRYWAAPGLSSVLLGRLLDTPWTLWTGSWLLCGTSEPHFGSRRPSQALILEGLGTSPIEFWRAFQSSFDVIFATPRVSHIMLLKMLCPRFDIYFGFSSLPCGAAVRAKHMELEPSWQFWPPDLKALAFQEPS